MSWAVIWAGEESSVPGWSPSLVLALCIEIDKIQKSAWKVWTGSVFWRFFLWWQTLCSFHSASRDHSYYKWRGSYLDAAVCPDGIGMCISVNVSETCPLAKVSTAYRKQAAFPCKMSWGWLSCLYLHNCRGFLLATSLICSMYQLYSWFFCLFVFFSGKPVHHDSSPVISHGRVIYGQKPEYAVGDSITIECYAGYTLRGADRIVYMGEGKWSPEVPTCHLSKYELQEFLTG